MDKSFPVRQSANPVLGVNRCECKDIRTIHQAKGKRAKFLYSICDTCGTDQRTGKPVQEKLQNYYPSVAELLASEQQAQPEKPIIFEETPKTLPAAVSESRSVEPEKPAITTVASRIETKPATDTETEGKPQKKRSHWFAVCCGVVLGGLTGGAIVRFS